MQKIEANKDAIDQGTKKADFYTIHIVSDGEGSAFYSEERTNGKIISTYLTEDNWDYKKEGEPLWEFLAGDEKKIKARAKRINGISEIPDPWHDADTVSDIFSSADGFSFKGLKICLSGDFEFGKKTAVTAYIEEQGGCCVPSVTKKTTVVLLGSKGSNAWSQGNYGTKAERAVALQQEGVQIKILREEDVFGIKTDTKEKRQESPTSHKSATVKEKPFSERKVEALIKQFDSYYDSQISAYNKQYLWSESEEAKRINEDERRKMQQRIQDYWIRLFGNFIETNPEITFDQKKRILSGCVSAFSGQDLWSESEEAKRINEDEHRKQQQRIQDCWIRLFGKYVEIDPEITFDQKKFVLSGCEYDEEMIQKITAFGGLIRSKISGVTDYLVVNPENAGTSKLETAIEFQSRGKPVVAVWVEDLKKAFITASKP